MGNDIIKSTNPQNTFLKKSQDIKNDTIIDIKTTKCIDIPRCHMIRDVSSGSVEYIPSFKNMHVSVSDKENNQFLSNKTMISSSYEKMIQSDISMCDENEIFKRIQGEESFNEVY